MWGASFRSDLLHALTLCLSSCYVTSRATPFAQTHPVQQGAVGVRVVVCQLPSKSPWLNPIEPKWVHGKRAVADADRLLSADELEARVYAY